MWRKKEISKAVELGDDLQRRREGREAQEDEDVP
jgi:hypothetical protein